MASTVVRSRSSKVLCLCAIVVTVAVVGEGGRLSYYEDGVYMMVYTVM